MRYDYSSIGFYTFDCLGWPFTAVPPGGGTNFIDELTLAVSGAAGTAAIAASKMGLKTLAVGGVGADLMGDWVLATPAAISASIPRRCSSRRAGRPRRQSSPRARMGRARRSTCGAPPPISMSTTP